MHYGFGIVREMDAGLRRFMDERGFNTIYDFAGKALPNVTEWKHLNLKHKVVANINPEKCIGCQLCYIACDDGAHQAIAKNQDSGHPYPLDHRGELRGLQPVLTGLPCSRLHHHGEARRWPATCDLGGTHRC